MALERVFYLLSALIEWRRWVGDHSVWLPSRAIRFASALHIQGPPIVNPSIFHPRADLSGRSMHCLWPPDLSEYLSFWSLVTVYT